MAERADESTRQFLTLYREVVNGLEEVMYLFRERPNLWARRNIETFLQDSGLPLSRRDGSSGKIVLPLIPTLYELGFLGLGTRDHRREVPGPNHVFDVRYGFLSDRSPDVRWEIAVIPPVFYDHLGMRSRLDVIVRPHQRLPISENAVRLLSTYNPDTNSFAE